ncbi:hypothetical protein [Oleiharenicola lentus]|uniref:hypothetical protein n=1 Tax=Oleiharenicola lentus TaxID=2508720 RepID=UPI003F66255F
MNLEELEALWRTQPVRPASDPAVVARKISQQTARLNRRAFILKLLLGGTIVGLVLELEPLAQLLRAHPAVDSLRFAALLAKFICHQILYAALAVFLVRRLRQHAARVRASSDSLRAGLMANLAGVEVELGDYRRAAWFAIPATALMLWSAYLNQAVAREGLSAFWPRAAFVIGFMAIVAVIARRDYRARLQPEHQHLRQLSAEWDA